MASYHKAAIEECEFEHHLIEQRLHEGAQQKLAVDSTTTSEWIAG